ncbi:MAG TPA: nicotinate-nucleotide--dimethylbenzimidazole phosphoribosyltransferase [Micromonosporaceae bacterium]|nr:nicotinate-nucleotide--dimethylbenzimidazole phosphoribosyltransferase [Micromonosporaceae bacterium]
MTSDLATASPVAEPDEEWLTQALRQLPGPDHSAATSVAARAEQVLRPSGALARLDEVATWLAGWQHTTTPRVSVTATVLFAADHGVARRGVSAYPADVTAAMVRALHEGVATAAAFARTLGSSLHVFDVGVGEPTGDITVEPALDPQRFAAALAAGRAAVAGLDGIDLLIVGEMGIGNTTPAAAVCAALYGGPAEHWTGRGTGLDDAALAAKVAVVAAARDRIAAGTGPIEILRQLGGAELAAIAGAVIEARTRSIPVLLDGYVVGAAVAPLAAASPDALDHCLAGHCSGEPGHRLLLDRLGKPPLLDLGLRLGEASGALAAVPLLRLAAAAVTDVATFAEFGLTR